MRYDIEGQRTKKRCRGPKIKVWRTRYGNNEFLNDDTYFLDEVRPIPSFILSSSYILSTTSRGRRMQLNGGMTHSDRGQGRSTRDQIDMSKELCMNIEQKFLYYVTLVLGIWRTRQGWWPKVKLALGHNFELSCICGEAVDAIIAADQPVLPNTFLRKWLDKHMYSCPYLSLTLISWFHSILLSFKFEFFCAPPSWDFEKF